jgi:vanillate/3-O-methylgallate O-demethylase
MLEQGDPFKYIDMPLSNYTSASYDKLQKDGKTVGMSMFAGYSYNERSYLSLAVVNPDIEVGTEVKLVWGEEGGGTKKPTVERHKQIEIRAIVSPVLTRDRAHVVRGGLAFQRHGCLS